MSTITKSDSIPDFTEDLSRGSSVSTGFVNEYEEILKYAIVAPKLHGTHNFYINKPTHDKEELSFSSSKNIDNSDKTANELIQNSNKSSKIHNNSSKITEDSRVNDKILRFNTLPSSALDSLLEYSNTPVKNLPSSTLKLDNDLNTENTRAPLENEVVSSIQSTKIDDDLISMSRHMDTWCLQLKRNVLEELTDMKMIHLQQQEQVVQDLKNKFDIELIRHSHELDSMRELLFTLEQNVKQKDEVIKNLADALNKQKERCDKLRLFSMWRLRHNNKQRQHFCSKMADKYYKKMLLSTVWSAWRCTVEKNWKQRAEKACQIKSQEVCVKLSEDYEERLKCLDQELTKAREEIAKMHSERECYEETMKKAFMRGVCALNMEAMNIFKGETNTNEVFQRNHIPSTSNPVTLYQTSQSANEKTEKKVSFNQANDCLKKSETMTSSISSSSSITKPFNVKMTATKSKTSKPVAGRNHSTITSVKVERHIPFSDSYSQYKKYDNETFSKKKYYSQSCSKIVD